MSLTEDFDLHLGTHLDGLKTLRHLPSGLAGQLAEVSTVLATFDATRTEVEKDDSLSSKGKAERLQAARAAAQAAVDTWRTGKVEGLDAHMDAQRAALVTQADQLAPAPTDVQVQHMVQRLAAFDPLEVDILYADANDTERRIIEAAANAIGRQPRRQGDAVVWEPLLSTERMAATIAARVERANPEGAAALHDQQRIRNTYDAIASTARGLLNASVPNRDAAPQIL